MRSRPPTSSPEAEAEAPGPLAEGALIAQKYRIERLIGKGGMGAVYLAEHELLSQPVAVKVLLAGGGVRGAGARLLNEARAAARIRSDHVVRIFDVGMLEDDKPFVVMELLQGSDLASCLRRLGPQSVEKAVDWALQALEAIAEAHAMGIVHRDLKPSNLFLARRPNGTSIVKVLDFGVATLVDQTMEARERVTAPGCVMGSPAYVAPEALRGSTPDARSDVWSLGVVLYELVTGELPFEGATIAELCAAILGDRATPLRELTPEAPEAFARLVTRCLEQAPERRYAGARELARALGPFAPPERASYVERIAKVSSRSAGESDRYGDPADPSPREDDTVRTDESWNTDGLEAPQRTRRARGGVGHAVTFFLGTVLLGLVASAVIHETGRHAATNAEHGPASAAVAGSAFFVEPAPSAISAEPFAVPSVVPSTATITAEAAPSATAVAPKAHAPSKSNTAASPPPRSSTAPSRESTARPAASSLKVLEDRL